MKPSDSSVQPSGLVQELHSENDSRSGQIRPGRLLVSVRDSAEFHEAIKAGVDLIDLKEPQAGSLGPVTADTVLDIAASFGELSHDASKLPELSLAMGELRDRDYTSFAPCREAMSLHYSFAKVGLAGYDRGTEDLKTAWREWAEWLPVGLQPVLVVYADWENASSPPPREVLRFAAELFASGVRFGLLVDTFLKSKDAKCGLFGWLSESDLKALLIEARRSCEWVALAGSLSTQTVAQAMVLDPDIVAIRGAACVGNRTNRIHAAAIAEFRRAMFRAVKLGV